MKFKGDIIITDPCYICKDKEEVGDYPIEKDYFSYNKEEDYPDYRKLSEEEINKLVERYGVLIKKIARKIGIYKSNQYQSESEKYESALQKYREDNVSDWELCNFGENMEELGIKNYICRDTLYGDWSCTTYTSDNHKVLGRFCADAGMVGVFLLDEVLKYNPDFDYHIERPWTTTLIKDFDGEIDFEIVHTKDDEYEDDSVSVVGKGNINFETHQTGL